MATPSPIETDALIIGAGPVGLFQVFQLGLLEVHAHVVDALPYPGGQCAALYGDKPIYDIPGVLACTGQELVDRLLEQISPFKPDLHFHQTITGFQCRDDGRFDVESNSAQQFVARTVFIAAGVGAFLPRRLNLPGLEAWVGRQVFEGRLSSRDAARGAVGAVPECASRVVVVGGDDVAIEQALEAWARGGSVTLLHRRDHFTAPDHLQRDLTEARAGGKVRFIAGQPTGLISHDHRLTHLQFTDAQGDNHVLELDLLITCLGLSPRLGPLTEWGLDLHHKQLVVEPSSFQTRQPGVYAVGDINTYPGKKKLILCGFHEATLAAHHAARHLRPDEPEGPLLYTTSSPKLQRLLGR